MQYSFAHNQLDTVNCCCHFSPHACRECLRSGQRPSGSWFQTPPWGFDHGRAQRERSPRGISSWLSWWIAAGASDSCRMMHVCACPPGVRTEQNMPELSSVLGLHHRFLLWFQNVFFNSQLLPFVCCRSLCVELSSELPTPSSHSGGCASEIWSSGTVDGGSRKTSCKHYPQETQTYFI